MESLEGEHIVGDTDRGSRKRQVNLTSKERKKQVRYSNHYPNAEDFDIACNHKNKNMERKVIANNKTEIKRLRESFFKEPKKATQDNKLLNFMSIDKPKRERSRKVNAPQSHLFSVKYYVISNNQRLQVCQKFIMVLYNVSRRRLNTICKKLFTENGDIKDKRGGDRRSLKNKEKLAAVKTFISQLHGKESHYSRQKSKRLYLSSEYSIIRLWEFYNEKSVDNLKVGYKYFSRVFNNNFNIGFSSPVTDVCGFCVKTQTKINNAADVNSKKKLQTELNVHKMRATQFHKLMKVDPENTASFCFDLQQVQVLPKVPIQDAFYSQQLAFYNFCVTKPNCQNPVFYSWLEFQAGRGATEISSALLHFLKTEIFSAEVNTVRLFSDGCSGQNKNTHVIHMLMLWPLKFAPKSIISVELVFPVRGHSYLPADRVFGRLEKITRRYSTIKCPEKYYEIFAKIGEVRKLGQEWPLMNIKKAIDCLKKVKGISACKRIFLKKKWIMF